jgi:hypothetical protein
MKTLLALVMLTSTAAACPDAAIDARLAHDAHAAKRWDYAWAAFFGVTAIAQGGFAAARVNPIGPDTDEAIDGLWVGAGKAAIGAIAHAVLPLRIVREDDRCASLRESGKREKATFWLDHVGGLLVNAGGTVLLGTVFHSWKEGLLSFALGYPVSLINTYTQPRGAWHMVPTIWADGGGVALAGTF